MSARTGAAAAAPGVLALPLVYDLVRRLVGRRAGLGAAAARAVLPAAILTAHGAAAGQPAKYRLTTTPVAGKAS